MDRAKAGCISGATTTVITPKNMSEFVSLNLQPLRYDCVYKDVSADLDRPIRAHDLSKSHFLQE
jgi:hypothetical protein